VLSFFPLLVSEFAALSILIQLVDEPTLLATHAQIILFCPYTEGASNAFVTHVAFGISFFITLEIFATLQIPVQLQNI